MVHCVRWSGIALLTLLLYAPASAFVLAQTSPLVISYPLSNNFPDATVGTNYGMNLSTSGGGQRPVTWSITAGSLPSGLSIIKNWGNSSTAITGTPKQAQTTTFTVQAKDKSGNTTVRTFALTVR